MKRFVALLIAVCLSITPITAFADTIDRSDLEEMSVKELKELRDMINDILGDVGDSTDDIYSKHPEWKEYDMTIPPYSDAILLSQALKDSVSNPALFKLKEILYTNRNSYDFYMFAFYVPTNLGGQEYQSFIVKMKDGEVNEIYENGSSEFSELHSDYFGGYFPEKHKDEFSYLDVKFIESQLD